MHSVSAPSRQGYPLNHPLVLASGSDVRRKLLQNAGLDIQVVPARIDEDMIKASLQQEGASPRDIADTLAEMKARKVSERQPDRLVLGCDQVLAFNRQTFDKPTSPVDAVEQLKAMRGAKHIACTAHGQILFCNPEPVFSLAHDLQAVLTAFR